jgi:hypothetical protein
MALTPLPHPLTSEQHTAPTTGSWALSCSTQSVSTVILASQQWLQLEINTRVVCPEGTPAKGPVGHVPRGVPRPVARGLDGVLVWGRVDGVRDPGVPERLDVRATQVRVLRSAVWQFPWSLHWMNTYAS